MINEVITEPLDIEFCTGCFFCIRTEVFKKLNGFDDRFLCTLKMRILQDAQVQLGRVVFYPDINVTHVWERASAKTLKFFLIQISSMFKYFSNGWVKNKKERCYYENFYCNDNI